MARTVWVEISPDFAYSVTEQISEVSCIFCLAYRPMLCRFLLPQLAVFITRCHALRRLPVCCQKMSVRPSVRLSVCLSHAGIASKWLNISSNILHRRICNSHAILVFAHEMLWKYSDGIECRGMKKSRFLTSVTLCLGNDTR